MESNTDAIKANISFYQAPATCVRYYKDATIVDIYRCITDPKVAKRQTETLRTLTDKDQRAQYKRSAFHYCTFSGSFGPNRKNDALRQHSGLICFDFDHLNSIEKLHTGSDRLAALCSFEARGVEKVKRLLLNDEHFHTMLLFTSPSGDGVKWVIEIELAQADHLTWFNAVSNYLRQTYGLVVDAACKNVARACFIPYDPNCYIDPELLPELQETAQEHPCVMELAKKLNGINIKIENYE